MNDNNLLEDKFYKLLCDDLCITYRTMGTPTGNMFALSRFTSQGSQQTYSATPRINKQNDPFKYDDEDDDDNTLPILYNNPAQNNFGLRRLKTQNIMSFATFDEEEEEQSQNPIVENENMDEPEISGDEIDKYVLDDLNTTCYANESTLNIMTQLSDGTVFL
jgi:hypothetical protein